MNAVKKLLEQLKLIKKKEYHPLIHKIHKKHGISKKTLLYVKEYGPKTNVPWTIIRESIKILLLASVLSSIGGLTLEYIKPVFISIIPLIILLPALNDMIGDYGSIISSRFSTLLHREKIRGDWSKSRELMELLAQIVIIAILTAIISSGIALTISSFSNYYIDFIIGYKIFLICIVDVLLLVGILFLVAIFSGLYFYKRNEDPNNFLIPITTSVADFGNMLLLALLVIIFF